MNHKVSSTPPPNMVMIEPLSDAEAEATLFAVVDVFDKLGCCPAALVTGKEDAGVSFALHFDATRARKLVTARSNQEADERETNLTGCLNPAKHQGRCGYSSSNQEATPDDDETYEIGKRDGYEKAVQDIDLLTGGDGEYRYCMGTQDERHCPDAETMKARIVERFAKPVQEATRTVGDAELGTVTKAICREKCAEFGDPPCWKVDPEDWNYPPNLEECGCEKTARAVLAALTTKGDGR